MNYDFTAQMEDRLDQANHQAEWKQVLDFFDLTAAGGERSGRGRHAAEPNGADQHRLPDLA
jgi:DNA topoisomerase IA